MNAMCCCITTTRKLQRLIMSEMKRGSNLHCTMAGITATLVYSSAINSLWKTKERQN